jgi:Domain of unknown function (DUF6471)
MHHPPPQDKGGIRLIPIPYRAWVISFVNSGLKNKRARLKRAGLTYADLAMRLNAHGMEETEGSVGAKLARGTFAVTFFLAVLAVLELESVTLTDL